MSQSSGSGPAEAGTGGSADESTAVALAVSKQRKEKKRAGSKASIARKDPLQAHQQQREGEQQRSFRAAWRRTAGDLSEAEQRKAVEQALEVFRLLPPSSAYAQHRIRVLEKALQLLDKARCVWLAAGRGAGVGCTVQGCAVQGVVIAGCYNVDFIPAVAHSSR